MPKGLVAQASIAIEGDRGAVWDALTQPDVPENYHTVTIELADRGPATLITLSQDNNATDEARRHSEENWRAMLEGLKKLVSGKSN